MSSFRSDFLGQLRSRVVLSEVVSQRVRLSQKGKEMVGLCPFHQEKRPSFSLNDAKGTYYCFGCGVGGDAIDFLKASENLTFVEAVTRLAERVGLPLELDTSPQHKDSTSQYQRIYHTLEAACVFFQERLESIQGEKARDYLKHRGISSASICQFRLGLAPGSKGELYATLSRQGITLQDMLQAGLLGESQEDGSLYERFRSRLIFPIFNLKGQVIAFGGRLLNEAVKGPKYLNSPETLLFFKKDAVYGLFQGKQNPGLRHQSLIWVEGYMDVISLQQAGLARAVASLGTAMTEQQILQGWKLDSQPLVCFDGDEAGRRAAFRLAKRVLALLRPGYSLSFVCLPRGEDPDSLLHTNRQQYLESAFNSSTSLVDFLWSSHMEMFSFTTPEQKAFVRQELNILVQTILDRTVRTLYQHAFQEKWNTLLNTIDVKRKGLLKTGKQTSPLGDFKPYFDQLHLQRKILLATFVQHPDLLKEVGDALATLDLPDRGGFKELACFLMDWISRQESSASQGVEPKSLKQALNEAGLAEVVQRILTPDVFVHATFTKADALPEQVREGWRDVLSHYQRQNNLNRELRETRAMLQEKMSQDVWERLKRLKEHAFLKIGS